MKKLVLILSLLLFASSVFAKDTYVRGYIRKDGTYVAPYVRSAPNKYKYDNYGSSDRSNGSSSYGYSSPYSRDSDRDGISNQYDTDDDNDGTQDDNE